MTPEGALPSLTELAGLDTTPAELDDVIDVIREEATEDILKLAGAGDELQGIKKGVLELADAIAINKADGNNIDNAKKAKIEYEKALNLLTPASKIWAM